MSSPRLLSVHRAPVDAVARVLVHVPPGGGGWTISWNLGARRAAARGARVRSSTAAARPTRRWRSGACAASRWSTTWAARRRRPQARARLRLARAPTTRPLVVLHHRARVVRAWDAALRARGGDAAAPHAPPTPAADGTPRFPTLRRSTGAIARRVAPISRRSRWRRCPACAGAPSSSLRGAAAAAAAAAWVGDPTGRRGAAAGEGGGGRRAAAAGAAGAGADGRAAERRGARRPCSTDEARGARARPRRARPLTRRAGSASASQVRLHRPREARAARRGPAGVGGGGGIKAAGGGARAAPRPGPARPPPPAPPAPTGVITRRAARRGEFDTSSPDLGALRRPRPWPGARRAARRAGRLRRRARKLLDDLAATPPPPSRSTRSTRRSRGASPSPTCTR